MLPRRVSAAGYGSIAAQHKQPERSQTLRSGQPNLKQPAERLYYHKRTFLFRSDIPGQVPSTFFMIHLSVFPDI